MKEGDGLHLEDSTEIVGKNNKAAMIESQQFTMNKAESTAIPDIDEV